MAAIVVSHECGGRRAIVESGSHERHARCTFARTWRHLSGAPHVGSGACDRQKMATKTAKTRRKTALFRFTGIEHPYPSTLRRCQRRSGMSTLSHERKKSPTPPRVGFRKCRQRAHGGVEQTRVPRLRHYARCRMPAECGAISPLEDGKKNSFFFIFFLPGGAEAASLNEFQDSTAAKAECSSQLAGRKRAVCRTLRTVNSCGRAERCRSCSRTCR